MQKRVAVIGSGIAGLSAAYGLKQAGFDPTVFEKDSFPGGRMSSEHVDGFIIDKAAYTFPEYHKGLTAFLGELGMSDALVLTPGTSATFAGGKGYEIKIGSATDFLKYKLLSLGNKADMVKLFLYAQSLGSALDMANPTGKTFELEKESASDYILANYSKEILEYVAWPIFCEIMLGNPEDNSKVPFLATLKNVMWFKIFSFRFGMGMLPERLAEHLDIRLNCPVLSVRAVDGKAQYEITVGGENPGAFLFDAVIFAVPSPVVPKIMEGLSPDLKSLFQEVEYSKSIVAALAVDREHKDSAMINNLCRDRFKAVGTLVMDHHKGPGRVPEGKGLATAILSEKASRSLFDEPDERVTNEVIREVDPLFPGFSERMLFSRVYRWEYGAVQFPPGALAKKSRARAIVENQFERICFAGDGFYKASLEMSYKSGIQAATRLIEQWPEAGSGNSL